MHAVRATHFLTFGFFFVGKIYLIQNGSLSERQSGAKYVNVKDFCAVWVHPLMRLGFIIVVSFLASFYLSQPADYPEQRRQFPAWEWELFSSSSSAFQRFDGRRFHILMDHHWFWFDGFYTYDWLAHNRWEWAHFEGNLFAHISLFHFCSVSHSQVIFFSIPFFVLRKFVLFVHRSIRL